MRVVFGPWIGELGWELTSWQGWVRKVCETKYAKHDKVIITFPGRDVLYQDIAANLDYHPNWFRSIVYSSRAYATDYWSVDGPKIKGLEYTGPVMQGYCERMLMEFKEKYPNSNFVVPWIVSKYKKHYIGGVTQVNPKIFPVFIPKLIPKNYQKVIPLTSPPNHIELLMNEMVRQGFDPNSRLALVFPRNRIKNSDKNWSIQYCLEMCDLLRKFFLDNTVVAIVGSPDGSLFFDGKVPDGCLDLVSIHNSDNRLNIHVAAMNRSVVGLGPASGIIHVAMWSGLPCICNIDSRTHKKYQARFTIDENPFKTKVLVVCDSVKPKQIMEEVKKICKQ